MNNIIEPADPRDHAEAVRATRARTIDGVLVVRGLRVIDYNFDKGAVQSLNHVAADGTPWFNIALDKGGVSSMDGLRMWTRVQTNDGWVTA